MNVTYLLTSLEERRTVSCAYRESKRIVSMAENDVVDKEGNSFSRHRELISKYFELIDVHVSNLVAGLETEMMELNEIARELCVSHKHLIAVIKQATGHHPCHFYIRKILEKADQMLRETDYSAAEIARKLTYDPSNFTKFYKKYSGMTPGQYRQKSYASE